MTQEQKLTKIIEKAVKNGYEFPYMRGEWDMTLMKYGEDWVFRVLFSHDFAKAYWEGEKTIYIKDQDLSEDGVKEFGGILSYPYYEGGELIYKAPEYIYHLQQAVISEDVIDYYFKFV